MEPEVIACNFWKAKKDTKYVLTVQFQPHGVLAQLMPFIEFVILATGGYECSVVSTVSLQDMDSLDASEPVSE
eukprot:s2336_g14.t1